MDGLPLAQDDEINLAVELAHDLANLLDPTLDGPERSEDEIVRWAPLFAAMEALDEIIPAEIKRTEARLAAWKKAEVVIRTNLRHAAEIGQEKDAGPEEGDGGFDWRLRTEPRGPRS